MYPSSEEHTLPVPPLGFERGAPTSEQSVDPQREKLEQLLGHRDVGGVASRHQIGRGPSPHAV